MRVVTEAMTERIDVEYSDRQKETIANPKGTLVSALNTFFNTMRLVNGARKGNLDERLFSTDFTLVNEEDPAGGGFQIKAAKKPMPLDLRMENVMLAVAGTVFLQFDEVAAQVTSDLKGGRFSHQNSDIRDALSILYLVRCAFAHNPLTPTWRIDRKFLQDRTFEVKVIGLRLDTTGLNGQVGVINRIGGWVGGLRLLDFCLRTLAPDEHEQMTASTQEAV
jgi:hypothetical protein